MAGLGGHFERLDHHRLDETQVAPESSGPIGSSGAPSDRTDPAAE
jgi:hypothetical protein